jgi:1-acyl-sn-glycerol-3-phosphate acyltransferase
MRTIFLFIIYVILVLLIIPVLLLCYLFRSVPPLFFLAKWALSLGQKVLGLRLEVFGLDRIDKNKTYVFMPNHLSFLDGPLMFKLIPHSARVILKKEIFRIPIIGLGMKYAEFVTVDRKGIKGGKQSIEQATKLIQDKGFSFLIFPEGTRSLDGKLQVFKRGGFFLAINSQADIVPVSIRGTYGLMPKGQFFVKRGIISVIFHPPLSVRGKGIEEMADVMAKVRETIASGLVADTPQPG